MTKNKSALIKSLIALMLSVSMLVGTTFAWFTDNVSSGNNIIVSGNVDVEMYWAKDPAGPWHNVENPAYSTIFSYDNWEPGYTDVKYIKIKNAGSLALNYKLAITPETAVGKLAEVINVHYATDGIKINDRTDLQNMATLGLLSNVLRDDHVIEGTLMADGQQNPYHPNSEVVLTLAMTMITTAGNDYQNETAGSFGITALASQAPYEEDSFGANYDSAAELPIILSGDTVSADVENLNGATANDLTLRGAGVSATLPAGTLLEDGADRVTLMVTPLEKTTSGITAVNGEILIPVDVHVDGVAEDNTTPIVVNLGQILPKGLNMGNYTLYHVEDGTNETMTLVNTSADLSAHNTFTYDPVTGEVSVAMASFSEVAVVADIDNAWKGTIETAFSGGSGTETDPYIIANADQLAYMGDRVSNDNTNYGDKHYKLNADVNLGGSVDNSAGDPIFYPIGYHKVGGTVVTAALDDEIPEAFYIIEEDTKLPANMVEGENVANWYTYGGSFSGTFDGNGHKVSNIYQNTWSMKGNYSDHYYNEAMGLFGYVNGGTVKNLTVDNFSSDGEFTPTGVIAAYAADSTFENIAITNCNPRVYNTGNGGIVGIGGNSSDPDTYKLTFTNVTIDNTNKITALWGSWDVACGGLVGMFRGAGRAYMTNCHVAAQIDVYNDVCGNYQYYWYRYSGMMIGTNKNMTTDANGYTVPETDKFHAKACTVHFGEWNDYYYCELVANSLASYTHDHQFSRLEEISSLDAIKSGDTWTKTGNFLLISGDTKTCYHIVKDSNGKLKQHLHTDAGEETVNGETVLKEDKQRVYLPFNQLFTGYGWGVKHIPVYNGESYAFEGITILDREIANSNVKFESKFTGDFLYRVGNQNAVSIGSLFKANDGATINNSGVWVSVDKVDENANVSGTFTANTTDWTNGTIQFSGTGVVKVTIQDYNYCKPTELYLEVVDAINATSATSATKNNVVLLQDCGFSSLEVSGGYTLFGNGFTMTCGSDSAALDMGYSFVTLDNGTLDNVQIVTPNFDYAVLYKSNMTESGNRSETTDRTRYYNVKNGVMASGNSQILNSRISGGRAALNVSGGNVVVDNSRIELGAVASILVGSANSLTLRDVTLVQKPTASTYDSSKTLMGFSVLCVCDADGNAAPITIEGTLVQNAWVDEDDKQYVPSAGESIISTVLGKTDYLHDLDGDGTKESLNLGFAYMPESLASKVNTTTITDNRTDKDTVPYDYAEVSILNGKTYVYSYKNTKGTADSFKTESEYMPNKYSDIITVTYSDTADGLTTGKSFGTDGWVYELNVDLDKLSGYKLDFGKLAMTVNGTNVTDFKVNGNAKPTSPVAVIAGGVTYTLTATVNGKEYTANYKVIGTETSKESPSLVASNYEAALLVGEAGSSFSKDTWHGATPVLNGIQIKYWSVAEKRYKTITLSDYTPTTAGKQNGTNSEWTYSPANGDFTLTIKNETAVHSSNSVYAMPVVVNSKLYFVSSSSNGLVNYGNSARTIKVNYYFKDNNGGTELKFDHTWSIECANGNTCYDYSDFCNGTSKTFTIKSSNGSGCVTPDTLVTLADGSQKQIADVKVGEMVVAWNFYTGKYENVPVSLLQTHGTGVQDVLRLKFEDGTELKVLGEHGIFDADLNTFIFIDKDDVEDYLGHDFVKRDGDSFTTVKFVDFEIFSQDTTAYTILSLDHYNVMLEGMFTVTPAHVGGNFFNPFDVGENMRYDEAEVKADIEKYGLYTYEDFEHVLTYEQFEALNLGHFKVSVAKGYITYDGLIYLIEAFVNNNDYNVS